MSGKFLAVTGGQREVVSVRRVGLAQQLRGSAESNERFDLIGSIVLYRSPLEGVREVLGSFLSTELSVRLYVVDNSPDDRLRGLCEDPRIEYIFNGRNLGFGAGHNIALKASMNAAAYHVVLNPDVYFRSGVLEELFEFARSHPDVGLLMPRVLSPDGVTQFLCKRLPTPEDLILRRFMPRVFKPLVEKRMQRYELRDQDYTRMLSVPVLSGCFMMFNCAALSHVGVFDERFFMYLEDVDLCRRVHKHYKTIYFPDVAIYHHHGKSSYRKLRPLIYHITSAVRYFRKWGWFLDPERVRVNRDGVGEVSL